LVVLRRTGGEVVGDRDQRQFRFVRGLRTSAWHINPSLTRPYCGERRHVAPS
jgi:hypothetical protein